MKGCFQAGTRYTSIAHRGIQDRRSTIPVPRGSGGCLHDCVPLYGGKACSNRPRNGPGRRSPPPPPRRRLFCSLWSSRYSPGSRPHSRLSHAWAITPCDATAPFSKQAGRARFRPVKSVEVRGIGYGGRRWSTGGHISYAGTRTGGTCGAERVAAFFPYGGR